MCDFKLNIQILNCIKKYYILPEKYILVLLRFVKGCMNHHMI